MVPYEYLRNRVPSVRAPNPMASTTQSDMTIVDGMCMTLRSVASFSRICIGKPTPPAMPAAAYPPSIAAVIR